jgi:pimeloyl-ACP methyl ester carboxylesterase
VKTPANDLRNRMTTGLPIQERREDIAGVSTAMFVVGEGPPLVLLHGGIECGGVYWTPVLTRLAEHYRVLVPDVPGLGESAPMDRLDADSFSRWLSGVMEVVGVEPPILVAHSLIGSMAARYAALEGATIQRLVIYAAPGIGPYRMPLRLRYVAMRCAIRPTARNFDRFQRFALHDADATRDRDPGWFDAFSDYTRARATTSHVKRTMQQLLSAGTTRVPPGELARITVPVDLVWGEDDRMVPISLAEEASTSLGWPLHVVPDAAHVPHMEQPEAFLRALLGPGMPAGSSIRPAELVST